MSLTPLNSFSAVSLTPAINFRLFGYIYRQDSLIAGFVDTAEKHSFAIISANFRKKSKWSLWITQGPGGHWFMKKMRSKISCQTPFKYSFCYLRTQSGTLCHRWENCNLSLILTAFLRVELLYCKYSKIKQMWTNEKIMDKAESRKIKFSG